MPAHNTQPKVDASVPGWIAERLSWLDSVGNEWWRKQRLEELIAFLPWLRARKPSAILEIGACTGSNLYNMAGCLAPGGFVMGIDISPRYRRLWKTVAEKLCDEGIDSGILVGDSACLASVVGTQKFDFVFVDGDHRYPQARQDYEQSLRILNAGGAIGFHDMGSDACRQLWTVLAPSKLFEIVHRPGSCGIGAVGVRTG